MKIAAYCRVSTDKDEQIDSLIHQKEFFVEYAKRNGHELFRLYADEGITGTSLKKREEFKRLLRDAELGLFDMVVVKDISRFARNTRDLLELVEKLTAKGVEFVSKKEAIDTTTPTGKFMLTVFGAVAELEREYILQRQKEGIAIAKANGVYKGRKPIERPDLPAVVALWRGGKITATEAMRRLDMKPSTFYRRVKRL